METCAKHYGRSAGGIELDRGRKHLRGIGNIFESAIYDPVSELIYSTVNKVSLNFLVHISPILCKMSTSKNLPCVPRSFLQNFVKIFKTSF